MKQNRRQEKMRLIAATTVLFAISILAACKKHKDNPNPPAEVKTSYIEIVHASPRTADIDVRIGGVLIPVRIKYLDKPGAYVPIQTKDPVMVQLSANGAVIAQETHKLEDKYKYTMFIYDTLDPGKKVKYLLVQDTFPIPGAGKSNIRFLHLAPQLASVDVDLFAGRDSIRLVSAYPYAGHKAPDGKFSPIASGEYRVRVRSKSGGASPVVLDIPSLKLEKGKTFSLYLYGLIKGTGDSKLGLQLLPHK